MEDGGVGTLEGRIAEIEKRVRDLDSLTKGLIQELVDLRSITLKIARQVEDRYRQDFRCNKTTTSHVHVMTQEKKPLSTPESTEVPPVSQPQEITHTPSESHSDMDLIMQPDGTMKMEARRGGTDYIVASASYGRSKKGEAERSHKGEFIYAEESTKTKSPKKF